MRRKVRVIDIIHDGVSPCFELVVRDDGKKQQFPIHYYEFRAVVDKFCGKGAPHYKLIGKEIIVDDESD